MHDEQTAFVASIKRLYPHFFTGQRVLEIGSRNINGTVRALFDAPAQYVGVDCTAGDGVDMVCLAHEYQPPQLFDVVISCEAFEHDPHFRRTLPHILSLLRHQGLFVATCAGPAREEHGTRRVHPQWEPFGPDPDYYHGLTAGEFIAATNGMLGDFEIAEHRDGQDLYAYGLRDTTVPPE